MRWSASFNTAWLAALELLAPTLCAACDAPRPQNGFCALCQASIVSLPEPATTHGLRVHAGAAFDGAVRSAVHKFKYQQRPDLAAALADLCAPVLTRHALPQGALWVPVPLHPRRLAERGYNQAALLARRWAKLAGGELAPLLLQRVVDTAQQAEQGAQARFSNVARAFEVRRPASLAQRQVILVDDVVTTGATLRACREAIERARASVVGSVAIAVAGEPLPSGPAPG